MSKNMTRIKLGAFIYFTRNNGPQRCPSMCQGGRFYVVLLHDRSRFGYILRHFWVNFEAFELLGHAHLPQTMHHAQCSFINKCNYPADKQYHLLDWKFMESTTAYSEVAWRDTTLTVMHTSLPKGILGQESAWRTNAAEGTFSAYPNSSSEETVENTQTLSWFLDHTEVVVRRYTSYCPGKWCTLYLGINPH